MVAKLGSNGLVMVALTTYTKQLIVVAQSPLTLLGRSSFLSATSGKFCTDSATELNGGARIYVSHDTPLKVQTFNDTNGATWAGWFTRMR